MKELLPKNDIYIGLKAYSSWGILGWHDIRQRYRRSILGPFWFTLSTAIMVIVLGFLYTTLLKQEIKHYLPYLAIGLITWQFISSAFIEGATALINSNSLIKQVNLPLTIYICRTSWRNFLILLHSMPIVILMLFFFGYRPSWSFALIPFGLLLLFLNGIWVGIILGVLSARFRDIPPIVNNFTQIALFLTPVMWSPEILENRAWVANWNPLYHSIEIIRAPLIGSPFPIKSWLLTLIFCFVNGLIAQLIMKRYRNRVAYWV
jgi:ABC-type polysaccharide/polyol phosphate export permease